MQIPLLNLAIGLLPVAVFIGILIRWSLDSKQAIYGTLRMALQLLLVGYFLIYIFEAKSLWIVLLVLSGMLVAASWIALQPLKEREHRIGWVPRALAAIAVGGVTTLILVTQFVLNLEPRWRPDTLIPLAGMIFANSMNCVSLAAERFDSETRNNVNYIDARRTAMQAALIPITNALFAVGIVSLPGMMTGQILSGVSPLIAARYQIMVMCMVFGSGGISAACFLWSLKPKSSQSSDGEPNTISN